jgi:hypothetical protein
MNHEQQRADKNVALARKRADMLHYYAILLAYDETLGMTAQNANRTHYV